MPRTAAEPPPLPGSSDAQLLDELRRILLSAGVDAGVDAGAVDGEAAGVLVGAVREGWPVLGVAAADPAYLGAWLTLSVRGGDAARLYLAGASRPWPLAGWRLVDVDVAAGTVSLRFTAPPRRPRLAARLAARRRRPGGGAPATWVHCDAVRLYPRTW